uniref:F-box associated beta-propeller type 3 domain-containing protein n=1 Tax=Leersia perrieri TaxID=77586 RepID=A0A0D9VGU6_9ORYZ
MADNGGHHPPPANGGGNQDATAGANGGGNHAQYMEANGHGVANWGNHAAPGNGGGGNQAAAAAAVAENGHAEANGGQNHAAAENGGGIHPPPPALRRIADEALYEVLLRMSAAEIARSSTACRRVRDMVGTDAFRRDYHRSRSRRPMPLFFYRVYANDGLVRVHLRGVDIAARASPLVIRFAHADPTVRFADPRVFRIEGSCDGILLLSYHTRLYACNPCTRRWGRLPPLHVDNRRIVGFYAAIGPANRREYRVLYHEGIRESDCRYWILTLSLPDQPARFIGRPTNLDAVGLALAIGITASHEMPHVTIGQRLYWPSQFDSLNVLVFDMVTEIFRWILPPRQVEEDGRLVLVEGDQLLEIDGMLAMTLVSQERVDIWVLQDDIGEAWELRYQIRLPVGQLNILSGYDADHFLSAAVLVEPREQNVLAQCPNVIIQSEAGGNAVKFYCLRGHSPVLSRYMHQESLLMHAFLPMRQGDAINGDPPFFQGHHPPPANGGGNQAAAAGNGGGNHAQGAEANGHGAANGGQNGGNHAAAAGNGGVARPLPALRRVADEALYEALLRMSAAEVARASTASRRVRDMVATDAFRRDHHRHRSRRPMPLFFYRVYANDGLVRIHLRGVDIAARESPPVIRFANAADPSLPFAADPRVFRIEGSCDGILLLSYLARLYACNPCTRRWGRLPPLHVDNHDIVGFYGHGGFNKREYRVLYHEGIQESDCRYWIFSLSFPDQPARYIGRPTNLDAVGLVLAHGIAPSHEMPPVTIGHRLYWLPQIGQDNFNVLVFDTVTEIFWWIPPPREEEDDDRLVPVEGDQLLEINGLLAMTLVLQERVDVWVLQDDMGEVWELRYQLMLPVEQLNLNNGYDDEHFISAAVLVDPRDQNVLAQCPNVIIQSDAGGNVVKLYALVGHLPVLSRYMLQESLLMHAFLPMRHSDAIDGDPPFFQGL